MDRVAAMLILLGLLVGIILLMLAFFSFAPVFCTCFLSLLYSLYLFIANEEAGIHHAQEFENRFWTIFTILFTTALFFTNDSPIAVGQWSPSLGFVLVISAGYGMHAYDRHLHRQELTKRHGLALGLSGGMASLTGLKALGIPVEEQLYQINSSLSDIDKLLIPSTINNIINIRFILQKEREIINIFGDADPKALNYLIQHVKLGLLFYKVKDHRHFAGKHRTELIETLAVTRISILSVLSRVLVLHALQMMKLGAHTRAEYWVRNIITQTKQDNLSELKTLTDAKGDYFCMNKLLYDDIRSESIRQDILRHLKKEAAVQHAHMLMNTKKAKLRKMKAWRKILSDVDDTLYCSGGSYPQGVDKRYGKKVVYPGVLSFYRELDLGLHGPDVWPENAVGNLVFLSARPHVYKDVSEKHNFAKFEKLKCRGMHTNPSLLAGDIASGSNFVLQNDMEPLAIKKFQNFKRYVSIYPEFKHVFVGDNGQGDVRAGDLMFEAFPDHLEALYVHVVKPLNETHGYNPEQWRKKGLKPCFFKSYPDAALDACRRNPPLIRVSGLRRVCEDAVRDFKIIEPQKWPSTEHYMNRIEELNQGIWRANQYMRSQGEREVALLGSDRVWLDGQKVKTPYGNATVLSFDPIFDMYDVMIDWRPLDVQVVEYKEKEVMEKVTTHTTLGNRGTNEIITTLATVVETKEADEDLPETDDNVNNKENHSSKFANIDEKFIDETSHIATNVQAANESQNTSKYTDNDDSRGQIFTSPQESANNSEFSSGVGSFNIKARIQGRFITNYVPPSLPEFKSDKRSSIFSFWGTGGEKAKVKGKLSIGNQCSTQYGIGIIQEHRKESGIIVVSMTGWTALAYLQEDTVQLIEKSLLGSIFSGSFRKKSQVDTTTETEKQPKELEFPYALGTMIPSPFGHGIVSRPLPLETNISPISQRAGSTPSTNQSHVSTIGISLKEWTLADETHPILYCTPETAKEWKNVKINKDKNHLFSVFGTIVSETILKLTSGQTTADAKAPKTLNEISFERYFLDGACVSTPFGDGRVQTFREQDGFYEINVTSWKLKGNIGPKAFLKRDTLSYRLAKGCSEGYPVLTSYGLSGNLASFDPTSGIHMVTVPSASMVCYLQPEQILKPLKAAVGEDVFTPFGEGTVVKLRLADNTFEIKMKGWNATMFTIGEAFDRVDDGFKSSEGRFGVNWLLRWMFFSSEEDHKMTNGSQRSRSSSITSTSVLSITK